MWTEHRFISFDETPIFYRFLDTKNPSKAIVLIVHGMGEHGDRYQAFGEYLAELGIACAVPDLRGYGQSGGSRAWVRHFSDYHQDLRALHSFLTRRHKDQPIFLMGHSLGGLIVSSYMAFSSPLKTNGIILSSPNFGLAIPVSWHKHAMAIVGSYCAPRYSESTRIAPEMLTHDRD